MEKLKRDLAMVEHEIAYGSDRMRVTWVAVREAILAQMAEFTEDQQEKEGL